MSPGRRWEGGTGGAPTLELSQPQKSFLKPQLPLATKPRKGGEAKLRLVHTFCTSQALPKCPRGSQSPADLIPLLPDPTEGNFPSRPEGFVIFFHFYFPSPLLQTSCPVLEQEFIHQSWARSQTHIPWSPESRASPRRKPFQKGFSRCPTGNPAELPTRLPRSLQFQAPLPPLTPQAPKTKPCNITKKTLQLHEPPHLTPKIPAWEKQDPKTHLESLKLQVVSLCSSHSDFFFLHDPSLSSARAQSLLPRAAVMQGCLGGAGPHPAEFKPFRPA